MPIQKSCTVVEAVRLNAFAYSFTLEAEGMTPEGPDQFVHVKCGHSRLLRRPISICDWEENLLRIVFEVRGEGTEWLSRRKAGDRLDVLGPLGRGFRMDREGRYLLVGGGIGVPPMLGCAKWTAERSTAVLGFRSADRAMLSKDFQKSCKEIFLCSDDGSIGRHGFVDAQVRDILEKDKDFTAVLACGPKPMAEKRGRRGRRVRRALPGFHGGADGLRRGGLSGLRHPDGRRHHAARVQGRAGI